MKCVKSNLGFSDLKMLRCKIVPSSWMSHLVQGYVRGLSTDPTPKVAFEKVGEKSEINESISIPPSTSDPLEALRKTESSTNALSDSTRGQSDQVTTTSTLAGGAATAVGTVPPEETRSLFAEWEEAMAKKSSIFANQFDVANYPGDQALKQNLSFDEVPGPAVLKYIAQAWSYIPVVGTQLTACAMILALNAGTYQLISRFIQKIFGC